MSEHKAYLVLHWNHTSMKTPVEYVEHIVYGNPRIDAVLVGSKGVAIVEYAEVSKGERVGTGFAQATFERMGSFGGIGASFTYDLDVALREFGIWVRHNAPGTVVGLDEAV